MTSITCDTRTRKAMVAVFPGRKPRREWARKLLLHATWKVMSISDWVNYHSELAAAALEHEGDV